MFIILYARVCYRQIIAIGVSFCLLWTSGNMVEGAKYTPELFARQEFLPQYELTPPASLGRVTDYWSSSLSLRGGPASNMRDRRSNLANEIASASPRNDDSPPLVVLIQDLHAHYGVQRNIAKILEFLSEKLQSAECKVLSAESQPQRRLSHSGLSTQDSALPFVVAVEGAQGPIDSSVMAYFPDEKIKEEALDYLMKEGELTGMEYFAAKRKIPNLLVGVEDQRYYQLHRDLFRKTLPDRQALVQALSKIQEQVILFRPKVYNRKLNQLQRQIDAFEKGELPLDAYVAAIVARATLLGIDLEKDFPTLSGYYRALSSPAERRGKLRIHLPWWERIKVGEKSYLPDPEHLRQQTASFLKASYSYFTEGERHQLKSLAKATQHSGLSTQHLSYYLYLRDVVQNHRLSALVPEELSRYLEYLHTTQTVNMEKLLYEAQELALKIKLTMATAHRHRERAIGERGDLTVQHEGIATSAFPIDVKGKPPRNDNSALAEFVQVEHDLNLLRKVVDLRVTEAEVRAFGPRMNQFVALNEALLNHSSSPSPQSSPIGSTNVHRPERESRDKEPEDVIRQMVASAIDYYALAMVRNKPMVERTLALLPNLSLRGGPAIAWGDRRALPCSLSRRPVPRIYAGVGRSNLTYEIASASPRHDVQAVVLVAGGFHTAGLTQQLRDRGVNYLVITPNIDKYTEADHQLYVERLRGTPVSTQNILTWAYGLNSKNTASYKRKTRDRASLAIGKFGLEIAPAFLLSAGATWLLSHNLNHATLAGLLASAYKFLSPAAHKLVNTGLKRLGEVIGTFSTPEGQTKGASDTEKPRAIHATARTETRVVEEHDALGKIMLAITKALDAIGVLYERVVQALRGWWNKKPQGLGEPLVGQVVQAVAEEKKASGTVKEKEPSSEIRREFMASYINVNMSGDFLTEGRPDPAKLSAYTFPLGNRRIAVVTIEGLQRAIGAPFCVDASLFGQKVIFVDSLHYSLRIRDVQSGQIGVAKWLRELKTQPRSEGHLIRASRLIFQLEHQLKEAAAHQSFLDHVNAKRQGLCEARGVSFTALTIDDFNAILDEMIFVVMSSWKADASAVTQGEKTFIVFHPDYLAKLNDDEFLAVYAHELGHHLFGWNRKISALEERWRIFLSSIRDATEARDRFESEFSPEERDALAGFFKGEEYAADSFAREIVSLSGRAWSLPTALRKQGIRVAHGSPVDDFIQSIDITHPADVLRYGFLLADQADISRWSAVSPMSVILEPPLSARLNFGWNELNLEGLSLSDPDNMGADSDREAPDTGGTSDALPGGLMGKIRVLSEPVFDSAAGKVRFLGKNLETGQEQEFEIEAEVIDPNPIRERLYNYRSSDNEIWAGILEWFLDSEEFRGPILLLKKNPYGIHGIGTAGIIGISEEYKDNALAIFHEVGETMGAAGRLKTSDILRVLKDRSWYDRKMADPRNAGMDLHYALRALQREVQPRPDRELTLQIQGRLTSEEARTIARRRGVKKIGEVLAEFRRQRDDLRAVLNREQEKELLDRLIVQQLAAETEEERVKAREASSASRGSPEVLIPTPEEAIGQALSDHPTANPARPDEKDSRPVSPAILNRALQRLPAFLLTGLSAGYPPGLMYRRVKMRRSPDIRNGVVKESIPAVASYKAYRVQDPKSGKEFVITELQLLDYPQEHNDVPEIAKQNTFLPSTYLAALSQYGMPVSDGVKRLVQNFRRQAEPAIQQAIDSLPMDVFLQLVVLHEVGAAVWLWLPESLKQEWSGSVYPITQNPDQGSIYLRALLYSKEDPMQFAEESFCDKFALFFLEGQEPTLEKPVRAIRGEERAFITQVLAYLQSKVDRGLQVNELESVTHASTAGAENVYGFSPLAILFALGVVRLALDALRDAPSGWRMTAIVIAVAAVTALAAHLVQRFGLTPKARAFLKWLSDAMRGAIRQRRTIGTENSLVPSLEPEHFQPGSTDHRKFQSQFSQFRLAILTGA